jgi:hypothetical protein
MPKGYSIHMADEIKSANGELLGVKLGRICLSKDIPVADVAEFFDVSRMSVYSWFRGKVHVSGKHVEKMEKLIRKLQ